MTRFDRKYLEVGRSALPRPSGPGGKSDASRKTSGVRLRSMRESDLSQVVKIEKRINPFPWTACFFRSCLRTGTAGWVWEQDDAIQGFGVMALRQGRAHILNLCMRPESQGRGLGGKMLTHMLLRARRRGARIALLEVRPSNEPALRLYRRRGFAKVGIRKGYYLTRRSHEDALIMARTLYGSRFADIPRSRRTSPVSDQGS